MQYAKLQNRTSLIASYFLCAIFDFTKNVSLITSYFYVNLLMLQKHTSLITSYFYVQYLMLLEHTTLITSYFYVQYLMYSTSDMLCNNRVKNKYAYMPTIVKICMCTVYFQECNLTTHTYTIRHETSVTCKYTTLPCKRTHTRIHTQPYTHETFIQWHPHSTHAYHA